MLKELKNQLLVSCIAAVALLLIGVWVGLHGIAWLSAALSIIVCLYLIGVNLWFSSRVSEPIAKLSDHARRIAEGTYGIKLEKERDDELGVLTEEINDMSEKVAIAEKSRTEFISQVSHELRTPLTAITGWAETIAYDPAVQGDSLRGIHIISKEAERLTGMVKELLEFTRTTRTGASTSASSLSTSPPSLRTRSSPMASLCVRPALRSIIPSPPLRYRSSPATRSGSSRCFLICLTTP